MAVALLLVAALFIGLYGRWKSGPSAQVPPELWLQQRPSRSLEARVSYVAADGYRPFDVSRGPAQHPSPSLEALATLERQGDMRGVAAAWLVRGDWQSAAEYLGKAQGSPDVDSDLAVVALGEGRPDEALSLADRALKARPGHPQAAWNRGLALRELGASLKAAESFEQVAATKEPGWSDEAARTASALRAEVKGRKESRDALIQAGRSMVETGQALSAEQVSELPGLARLYFYDAVRAAPSTERVLSLLGVAEQLDRIDSGTHLATYVRRIASRDFSQRGPLAKTYAQVVLGTLPPAELPAFLDRLRRSREQDILLGALLFSPTLSASLEEYQRLAVAADDPWFELIAAEKLAEAELIRGEAVSAEVRLLEAHRRDCDDTGRLDYRCGRVEWWLARVYDVLHRPADARRNGVSAMKRGVRGKDSVLELIALEELGQITTHIFEPSLTHGYLEEVLARMEPATCEYQQYVHMCLASVHHGTLDFDGARREASLAIQCGKTPSIPLAFELADLARVRPLPEDAEPLRKSVEAVRTANPPNPGEVAAATHIEGRFELTRNRALGQSLLRRAIDEADRLPEEDVPARKARAYSYSTLLLDAGKHGEYDATLELFAAELKLPPPSRCALGVTLEDERTLIVLRDAEGKTRGSYDERRTQPFSGVAGLIPPDMVEALRSCESVEVFARAPVQGQSGLLPSDMAWSYRVGAGGTPPSKLPERRLIVSEVEIPAELQRSLPRLAAPPEQGTAGDALVLRGSSATPSRVLEAMGSATEVAIHTHGLAGPEGSDASLLVLAKGEDGRFALTAHDIQGARLAGHPMVLLAACYSGQTAPWLHGTFGLPIAFIQAGARGVIAATVQIPNSEAYAFFEPVLARIRAGEPPAVVLRDERQAWLKRQGGSWVEHVLLFQ